MHTNVFSHKKWDIFPIFPTALAVWYSVRYWKWQDSLLRIPKSQAMSFWFCILKGCARIFPGGCVMLSLSVWGWSGWLTVYRALTRSCCYNTVAVGLYLAWKIIYLYLHKVTVTIKLHLLMTTGRLTTNYKYNFKFFKINNGSLCRPMNLIDWNEL